MRLRFRLLVVYGGGRGDADGVKLLMTHNRSGSVAPPVHDIVSRVCTLVVEMIRPYCVCWYVHAYVRVCTQVQSAAYLFFPKSTVSPCCTVATTSTTRPTNEQHNHANDIIFLGLFISIST